MRLNIRPVVAFARIAGEINRRNALAPCLVAIEQAQRLDRLVDYSSKCFMGHALWVWLSPCISESSVLCSSVCRSHHCMQVTVVVYLVSMLLRSGVKTLTAYFSVHCRDTESQTRAACATFQRLDPGHGDNCSEAA